MNTIVVVSEAQADFTLFSSNFAHLPIHFSWARSIDEAIEKLAFEQPFILFVVSHKLEQLLDWLSTYTSSQYQIPLVSFSGGLDWAEREMLWKSGVSDIVELPRNRKELEYIISAFLIQAHGKVVDSERQMQGRLQDLSLIDLIRSFSSGSKSGILNVEQEGSSGYLEFSKGKVVHAVFADCEPLEAVLVMSLWKEGVFFGNYSETKFKESIHLNNDQIIEECQKYQITYQDYLKKLPDWDTNLYTDPDLEYQEFGPKDREILQQFRNGLSLQKFMPGFNGNWNFVLKKFMLWLDRKWILKEDTYRMLQAQIRADQRKSAFRKAFDKVFSKDQKAQLLAEQESEVLGNESLESDIAVLPNLFNQPDTLISFLDSDEGLLEIPVLVADEQEDSIFFTPEQLDDVIGFDKIRKDELWLSERKSIVYYRVVDLDKEVLWSDYDALFCKVPFILVLFHRENVQVQKLIQNMTAHYETPIFFISSKPVNPTDSIKEDKNLVQIDEQKLILFDSLSDEKMIQVFTDAIRLRLSTFEPDQLEIPVSDEVL